MEADRHTGLHTATQLYTDRYNSENVEIPTTGTPGTTHTCRLRHTITETYIQTLTKATHTLLTIYTFTSKI